MVMSVMGSLSQARVMLINSPFTFHYRARNSPSLFTKQTLHGKLQVVKLTAETTQSSMTDLFGTLQSNGAASLIRRLEKSLSHYIWKVPLSSPSLTINENAIEQVTSAKSLGVYVDQNINWECHIENISYKIACAIGAIKRIRHLTPFNVLIKVYNSLIQPHFDYCNVVWGNCNKGLSEKLQRLQNRAARILMSASYDSNLDDLFRALGWRRLHYQRLEQKSILMYKTLHGMTLDYLRSRFVYRDNARAYRLRNTENKLVLPQPRTDYLKRSFLYSGAQLWNNLPVDLRQASSLTDFKSKLSRHSLK